MLAESALGIRSLKVGFIAQLLGRHRMRSVFSGALPFQGWACLPSARTLAVLIQVSAWTPWLDEAAGLLDASETERVQRKRNADDRETLVLAYALHRLLLGQAMGLDAAAVPLWRDSSGRPRVGDDQVRTSLSHARGWVALAVSAQGPVGVDVEPLGRLDLLSGMEGQICHPDEAALLQGLSGFAYHNALLATWVRKEAVLKAAGIGLVHDMNSFTAWPGEVSLPTLVGHVTWIQMLDAGPECVAAVASVPWLPVRFARLVPSLTDMA